MKGDLHGVEAVDVLGQPVADGRVFRLAAHSARLINSARLLDYELPWTREQIEEATRAVVKANNLRQGYIRPIAWRGSEVMGVSGIGTTVHLAIAPWDQEGKLSVQARGSGINVTMAKYRRPSPEVAPGEAKVAGLYIICGIEKDRALKAGFRRSLSISNTDAPRRAKFWATANAVDDLPSPDRVLVTTKVFGRPSSVLNRSDVTTAE